MSARGTDPMLPFFTAIDRRTVAIPLAEETAASLERQAA